MSPLLRSAKELADLLRHFEAAGVNDANGANAPGKRD